MVSRTIADKLLSLAGKFPVVAIVGPRQSGKTTLVRSAFPKKDYTSLEDLDTRDFALKDPRGFLASHPKGAIIDEAQRVPSLFSYIQTAVDEDSAPGRFILTGSQNILLQENLSQSLAGRVAILQLLPFSLAELKGTAWWPRSLEDCLFTGMYPRVYDQSIAPTQWYPNYIRTYIERDVRLIKNIADLNAFQTFVRMCASRVGQLLNLSSLGNDCGITHNTAKAWLSILEATYITFLVRPHHRNLGKRLVKMPKLYFYDTGLACSLLGIDSPRQLETHYMKGPLFESLIFSEIIKGRLNKAVEPGCFFWRDKSGNEVDCLVEAGNRVIGIEVKSGKTIADDFFDGLICWQKLSGARPQDSYLIYGGDEDQRRSQANVLSWRNVASL
jgi:predicted AAA+ superfamily ATPase